MMVIGIIKIVHAIDPSEIGVGSIMTHFPVEVVDVIVHQI